MLRTDEILSTIRMLHAEHLDVRAVTMALNLNDCASPSVDQMCKKVYHKIVKRASRLVDVCEEVSCKYGIPITNKRIAISPAAVLLSGHNKNAAVQLAKALDEAGERCRVDFVGGFSALVQKGVAEGARVLIEALPEVLNSTKCVCASVNAASRKAGINMDALHTLGHTILETRTSRRQQRICRRETRRLCEYSGRQPVHGGRVHGRRRAGSGDQYWRLRAGRREERA